MSSDLMGNALPALPDGLSLWLRQLLAIFRIEFGKALFSRRALLSYLLAGIPLLVFTFAIYDSIDEGRSVLGSIESSREMFGYIFSTFILGAVIFLGSAAIFTGLFRGEILERSIHYYLLSPVRREILVLGKFLAGLASAMLIFGLCTTLSFLFMYLTHGPGALINDLGSGLALQQLLQYLGITLLACIGYGSVFMATGLWFRNPLIPVVVIAAWEFIHFILPPALKVFSVTYYLKGLLPIPLDEGPLAVLVAPPPVWVSIVGMGVVCGVMLGVTIILLKRLELQYAED